MSANSKSENRNANGEVEAIATERRDRECARFLTREELAEALQISVRTVDAMVLEEGLPHLRLKGCLVRFYLPDVVRHLTATALTAKRRWPGLRRKE